MPHCDLLSSHHMPSPPSWCTVLCLQDLADKLFAAPGVTCSPRFSRTKRSTCAFTLSHYAGPVSYSLDNFLDKNRDFVVAEHQSIMAAAGVQLLSELFGGAAAAEEAARAAAPQHGKVSSMERRGGGRVGLCVGWEALPA